MSLVRPQDDAKGSGMGNGLEVTDVRVAYADAPQDVLKAHVTIELNGGLVVHNLKVIAGHRGLFVSMPARRRKDGGFSDIVHPGDAATREMIERAVLAAYRGDDWGPEGAPVGARIVPPPDHLAGAVGRELPRDAA